MTGGVSPDPGDGLVPGDLGTLHRTAALLTADADAAVDLLAQVLHRRRQRGNAPPPPDGPDALDRTRAELVRAYLRTAPRRPGGPGGEGAPGAATHGPGADAYDVLRGLRPRARAVTVLRVAHGWDLDATAAAVGLSPRRAEALQPNVPGLDRALEVVGEQHHLSPAEVLAAVGALAAASTHPPHRPRRWGTRLLAGAVAAVATWSVLTHPDAGADPPPAPGEDAGADRPVTDLTAYGWHLDEDGEPPVVAMGLQRQSVTDLPYADPVQEITWDAGHLVPGGPAAYAVLWCDLPPDDPRIEQPSARLTTGAGSVHLPCAGRDGMPPVHQVTAVPVSGPAQVDLLGDLPRSGGATLALYREGALSGTLPLPQGSPVPTDPPPVPTAAAVVDEVLVPRDWAGRTRLVSALRVSAETELQVWAGRTGSVSVFVDGLPVTDDGDLARPDDPGWQDQQVDLRDGRWVVYLPGTSRTFPLPELLRPPDGRSRVVTVEVFTQGMEEDLQVLATQAEPAPARSSAGRAVLLTLPGPDDFPPRGEDHRLVGAWTVPQDGLAHDLPAEGGTGLPPGTELVAFTGAAPVAAGPDRDEGWGLVQIDEGGRGVVRPVPLAPGDPDVDSWSARRLDPWRVQQDLTVPVAGSGHAPQVWLPAVPGHAPATVLAVEPLWDNGAR